MMKLLERADHLMRRKELYEERHPIVKYYSPERMSAVRHSETISSCQPSFSEDTAEKTKLSRRTVEQEVQIAKRIAPEIKEIIRETSIADNKTELLSPPNGT